MRRVVRIALELVVVAALSGAVAATASSTRPPRLHARPPAPVSVLPYIAPWQTGFERYATQIYPLQQGANQTLQLVVPSNQWYRIVFISEEYLTENVPGNRLVSFNAIDPSGRTVLRVGASASQAPNTGMYYYFAPGAAGFASAPGAGSGQISTPLPDVLYPPGYTLRIVVDFAEAGDGYPTDSQWAGVEIYTEDRGGSLRPSAPTPNALIP